MNTPIYDFVNSYIQNNAIRMHMPGHKGVGEIEKHDITEISGADSLYEADGIIKQSERNASLLFGADTFYSAEGSSLSIRASLYLLSLYAKSKGQEPVILAARNVHKVFVSAVALLGIKTEWITVAADGSYLSSAVTPDDVERAILSLPEPPTAVYITSPDYLGVIADIKGISDVCKRHGVLLAVDNAHGAYLKFLENSLYPTDLGADICASSAHKTLPCLTGAAYLHISKDAPSILSENAKDAMALFGSTSPSYLILSSLDKANEHLASDYKSKLAALTKALDCLKNELISHGYTLYGNESMKLTICAKEYGYFGCDMAKKLEECGIMTEFADRDFVTLMPSTKTTDSELEAIKKALLGIEKREKIEELPPKAVISKGVLTPREAVLSPSEVISVNDARGRILADITVGCPPAVPIIVSGEAVDEDAISAFLYYGIEKIKVVKQ